MRRFLVVAAWLGLLSLQLLLMRTYEAFGTWWHYLLHQMVGCLGHISIHTGPSPTLVALSALLLAGWGWIAAVSSHRRTAAALAGSAVLLVLVACLLAEPIPSTLEEFPTGPVSRFG